MRDGQEALDYLFARGDYTDRSQYPVPVLILLDLKLPGVGGLKVLEQLKNAERLKRIPVVILTSSAGAGRPGISTAAATSRLAAIRITVSSSAIYYNS